VAEFVEEMENTRKQHNSIFFIGNGGSAATASHMANDFGIGVHKNGDQEPFRVLSLTDNVATMTAVANDHGYDNLFVGQLRTLYRKGDMLVAISASGNSPNVIAAAEWVKARGGKVIGLVGFDGGRLKEICDIRIHIKTRKGEYGPVEDVHIILEHLIHSWLLDRVRKEVK
jgi:D-sedoheptulose 7-phosphate isomerase